MIIHEQTIRSCLEETYDDVEPLILMRALPTCGQLHRVMRTGCHMLNLSLQMKAIHSCPANLGNYRTIASVHLKRFTAVRSRTSKSAFRL
jgi:hypothetical protein